MDIEDLQQQIRDFAQERDWEQFHTIRNVLLALIGEVGELAESVQWAGEITPETLASDDELRTGLEHEIADVLIYVLRLADVAGIRLSDAVTAKMRLNAEKYPADEVRGSAAKR